MAIKTCHSRWCPYEFPGFWDNSTLGSNTEYCKNVTWTFENYLNSAEKVVTDYFPWMSACCKLFCGENSQLLQLQCQWTSERIALLLWIMVGVLGLCAIIQLLSISLEKGARKVAKIGEPLFLAFIALVVYVVAHRDSFTQVYTPYLPIVGAINVCAFSYYFSSFQYSIGITYELASATALVFTMFPLWTLLTVKTENLPVSDNPNQKHMVVQVLVWLILAVLAMLILSLLWIIHSSLYRTVGYRAAWITAFNKQSTEQFTLVYNLTAKKT